MTVEKCWCGKELVKDLGRNGVLVIRCPIHGENYELSQKQVIALVEAVKAAGEDANEPVDGLYLLMPGTRDKINAVLAGLPKGGA